MNRGQENAFENFSSSSKEVVKGSTNFSDKQIKVGKETKYYTFDLESRFLSLGS